MVRSISAVATLLCLTAIVHTAAAQESASGRTLKAQIRVQVQIPGIDSTRWFRADIRRDTEGCQLIQLREVGYRNEIEGAWVDSTVPINDRAVLPVRSIRAMETRDSDEAVWQRVDVVSFKNQQGTRC